jgi:hypothetical protein
MRWDFGWGFNKGFTFVTACHKEKDKGTHADAPCVGNVLRRGSFLVKSKSKRI